MGLGMGFAMMPLFSGAMQTLRKAAVARASTTLNILQQFGASIGTAVMSVLLTDALTKRLPAGSGNGLGQSGKNLPEQIKDLMADAFGHTYIWAAVLVCVAIVAAFFLPRVKPAPIEEEDEGTGGGEAAPVLIHA